LVGKPETIFTERHQIYVHDMLISDTNNKISKIK